MSIVENLKDIEISFINQVNQIVFVLVKITQSYTIFVYVNCGKSHDWYVFWIWGHLIHFNGCETQFVFN